MVNHIAVLEREGFSLLFSLNASVSLSKEQLLSAVYEELPKDEGGKFLILSKGEDRQVFRDTENEGPSWLRPFFVEEAQEEEDQSPLKHVPPIFRLGSTALRIVMIFAAVILPRETRFHELRHLLRTLQYVYLYDWSKEANLAYLGSKKNNRLLRIRRGVVLGIINLITTLRKSTLVGILILLLYLVFN